MINVFGIKSCDTCRKALAWLSTENIGHTFHDLRADGIEDKRLAKWAKLAGWEVLLNRRSTTWRQLPAKDTAGLDEAKAIRLMTNHPTLIKRPVFERGSSVFVGFSDAVKDKLLEGL